MILGYGDHWVEILLEQENHKLKNNHLHVFVVSSFPMSIVFNS